MNKRTFILILFSLAFFKTTYAQVDARLLRFPDVSKTQITFVYGGDIWVMPIDGGTASRLSTPAGEETFPRFSPDGSEIAFSGNYEGNTDIYVIPSDGGTPKRLTHHPLADRMLNWYPDGKYILYASSMQSGRQRFNQLYKESVNGGLPEKLPVPYGEFGAISPDGEWLAYVPKSRDFRHWKGYRGGWAPDIWLFNLKTYESKNITHSAANETQPMWHGRTLYFLSDRGPDERYNIWAYSMDTGKMRQVTHFDKYDIHFPAIGPNDMVFEAGGELYLMDLATEKVHPVNVRVVTDNSTLIPHTVKVSDYIQNADISPKGERAVIEARGDIFTLPKEHGIIRDITRTSGYAERFPAWSPDGRQIAYWSDRSGEYELTLRNQDGSGKEQQLTKLGPGFRYHIYWSPDGKKLAFIDQNMDIQIYDMDQHKVIHVDNGLWMYEQDLDHFRPSWSPDSRWLAYARGIGNRHDAIFIYDTKDKKTRQVTSGFYDDTNPVFGTGGKYLYYVSGRSLHPDYSDIDETWIYTNTQKLVSVSLRPDVPSLLAARNDTVSTDTTKSKTPKTGKEKKKNTSKAVDITFDGFEQRAVVLPPAAGHFSHLEAAPGKIIFKRNPRTGSDSHDRKLQYYDLKERKAETILGNIDGYQLSADHEHILAWKDHTFAIIQVAADQHLDKPLATADMEMTIDPRAEWHQIFNDVWRMERDYFYDKDMHGVNWNAMRKKYEPLINNAVTRWDVNFILGELIGEINSSHTYDFGGDTQKAKHRGVGLLGVNWELENGAFRIAKIIHGAPWDIEVRSPFDQPDINVKAGDYVLAVDGKPMDTSKDPWASLQGLENKTVVLTVNDKPMMRGAREVTIKTLNYHQDTRLRHLAWIEAKRELVERKTDGKIGYIYVPDTGTGGQTELVRQFNAQFDKAGLIIDERFNSGGQVPNRFIELLDRSPIAFWAVRNNKDWQTPTIANFGPKAMLINGWSGSGGDAFPYFFREKKLGPLIGTRTWGGLIGYTGVPPLIDGGEITVPSFRMYNPEGKWFPEGHGVDPDIRVVNDPTSMARGEDPQLDAAIKEVMKALKEHPFVHPHHPPYPDRALPGTGKQ